MELIKKHIIDVGHIKNNELLQAPNTMHFMWINSLHVNPHTVTSIVQQKRMGSLLTSDNVYYVPIEIKCPSPPSKKKKNGIL